jgi:TonB family protein
VPALVPPVPIEASAAPYPEGASGDAVVVVEVVVDREGQVESVRVIDGEEPFASAATDAARAWRYSPAMRGDSPVPARIRARIEFHAPVVAKSEEAAVADPRGEAGNASAEAPPSTPAAPPPPPAPDEVRVRGDRAPPEPRRLGTSEVRQLPGAFGDPFRAIEAMPGVTPLASGLPYFFVRGSAPGNTAYLLDGVRVPALFHVGVGPSVVHPSLLEQVDFYPGAAPAEYGRVTGGVVTGTLRAPEEKAHGEATIRVFDAGGLVEAPLDGGRGTALAAARYSYAGLVLPLFAPNTRFAYWDYQTRATWKTSERDTLSLLAFGTFDTLRQRASADSPFIEQIGFTFHRLDLRFDHRLDGKGRLRFAVTLGYDRSSQESLEVQKRMVATRVELDQPLSETLRLRLGSDARFEPYDAAEGGAEAARVFPARDNVTAGGYAELRWRPRDGVEISPGVRSDFYASTTLDGQVAMASIDARVRSRIALTPRVAWTTGAGIMHQPPSAFVSFPGLETGNLADGLQAAAVISQGVETTLPFGFSAGATGFYNAYYGASDASFTCPNLGDFQIAARCTTDHVPGRAFGVELLVRRALTERIGGMIAYTLSRSERRLPDFAGGEAVYVPSKFDRPHVLNIIVSADLGLGFFAGARLFSYSGAPYSPIYRRAVPPYDAQRLDPFNRLDLRFEKRWFLAGGARIAVVAELLNTLLSREAVGVTCTNGRLLQGEPLTPRCDQTYVGPVSIPSLGIEGKL